MQEQQIKDKVEACAPTCADAADGGRKISSLMIKAVKD
jgi:hypothetical protein